MGFSLRLDRDTETRLRRIAARRGWSKAAVVREAIESYAGRTEAVSAGPAASAFDRLAAHAGVVSTGGAQLSGGTHDKYRSLVEQKHRGRRPR